MSVAARAMLRVSIGYLLVIWGVDKLVNPAHGLAVSDRFYLGVFTFPGLNVASVTRDLTVAADSVSNRGRNLIRRVDTNPPASIEPGLVRSVAAADASRPRVPVADGLRLIEADESSGRSRFDGLYLHARQRLTRGVAFDVAYTLSRIENNTDGINFRPVDSRQPDRERGPSLNDRRHVLAINGLIRVPFASASSPCCSCRAVNP